MPIGQPLGFTGVHLLWSSIWIVYIFYFGLAFMLKTQFWHIYTPESTSDRGNCF